MGVQQHTIYVYDWQLDQEHLHRHSWMFVGCRGYKVVVKFFPNEAANLEPVVDLLLTIEQQVLLMPSNTAKFLAADTCV